MRSADHRDESIEQDGLCIVCRATTEKDREEDATASFCTDMSDEHAAWFASIWEKCGMQYATRWPSSLDRKASLLTYAAHGLRLDFIYSTMGVSLSRKGVWSIEFSTLTPLSIILATIKAAVEHESK